MNHAQHAPDSASTTHNNAHGTAAVVHSGLNDSPQTPVDSLHVPDVKIDMDYQEQESDVRHEPLPIKPIAHHDKLAHASAVGAPIDPSTVTIHTDMNHNGHLNGLHNDILMGETDSQTPAATPGISGDFSMASIDGRSTGSATRSYPEDSDDHQEPPAKRMRTQDVEMRSQAQSATPPPASVAMSHAQSPAPPPPSSVPPTTGSSTSTYNAADVTLSTPQYRFLASTVRTLKKLKDSGPFLRPVDPIALNIPHYPSIVKTPMDFSTIERKLNSSNPAKPDPNPYNPRYHNADEFIADVRLMVSNAVLFNGPDHVVATMGKRMEDVFDKQMKHLPPAVEKPKPPVVKKVATPPAPPPQPASVASKKAQPLRRASTSVPTIRRSDAEPVGRPKREIHPPPPKDLPYADAPKKNRKVKRSKSDIHSEQLRFCSKILADLHKKQYYGIAYPFYEPVDWQKLEIPSYPKIIKKPMDLATMRKKLDGGEYETAHNFYDDFKLMIRNCFTFNPSGTPVNVAGQELQRLFDDKWKALPPLQVQEPSEDEEEEEEDSDEERRRTIAMMESQIETMKNNIESLKGSKLAKEKKKEKKKEKAPVASTSKPPPKAQPKAPSTKKKTKKTVTDDDVLTFEQKKDLSESIGKLDGARLERVIQIIHEGVPEIRDSTEEIELEIDQLPAAVLTKLYNFVLRPIRQPAQPKRNRTGKGTGTGGLKRKSMDEEKEAEKIRQLEERMALFEPRGAQTASAAAARRDDDSEHSSDSSSGSDSSGSDSD
ncbi:Bromodomain-containing protein [Pholiota conissans]|uniref:Bromodomain-containing protein n=1 Tax=Pholiota conissans TaxID=109636 RepID=A0A9P5Z3H8_9AGAR|nr:Bromodomain-containing protein [Pholiota conissans]